MSGTVRASCRAGRGVNASRERERAIETTTPQVRLHVRRGRTALPDEPFILLIGDGTGPDAYSVFLHRTKREHRYRSLENARAARDGDAEYREVYRRRKGVGPCGPWTVDEELALTRSVALQLAQKQAIDYAAASEAVGSRTPRQCRARWKQLDWDARGVRKSRRHEPKKRVRQHPRRAPTGSPAAPAPAPAPAPALDSVDLGTLADLLPADFLALPPVETDRATTTTEQGEEACDADDGDWLGGSDDPPPSPLPTASVVPPVLVKALAPERGSAVQAGSRWRRTLFGDNQLAQSLLQRQPSFAFPRQKRQRSTNGAAVKPAPRGAGAAALTAPAFLESTEVVVLASPESACA